LLIDDKIFCQQVDRLAFRHLQNMIKMTVLKGCLNRTDFDEVISAEKGIIYQVN